jgi:hypothetical protein
MRAQICRKAAFAMETFLGITVITASIGFDEIGGDPPVGIFTRGLEK